MKQQTLFRDSLGVLIGSLLLSMEEYRLLIYLSSMVKYDDEGGREYKILVSEYCAFMKISPSSYYGRLRTVCAALLEKRVYILPLYGGKDFVEEPWLRRVEDYPKHGRVGVFLAPLVQEYLLQWKELADLPDTAPDGLEGLKKFKSAYAFRFYEILKPYLLRDQQECVLSLHDLRWLLNLADDAYKEYFSLKKQVLLTAQRELNEKSDVSVFFSDLKLGRRVEKVKFALAWKKRGRKQIIKRIKKNFLADQAARAEEAEK